MSRGIACVGSWYEAKDEVLVHEESHGDGNADVVVVARGGVGVYKKIAVS
ncbi:hypothetical protein [Bartonella rattaustraliani]|nr:hypothetical protein [Bartonella rattaustraliani]